MLDHIKKLLPAVKLTVFSFKEDTWEPPFLEKIRDRTLAYGDQFYETKNVDAERWKPFWENTAIDLMLVVSWRYMIPERIYQRPRHGAFVFHDSLLPKYRGFSPTVWAMLNGETFGGATLFRIAAEVDAGDIVGQISVPIGQDEAIATVMEHVTQAYLGLLDQYLGSLVVGEATLYPQNQAEASYTCKRLPEDNIIQWSARTEIVYNLIRSVSKPYTGAYTTLSGQVIRIWASQRLKRSRIYTGTIPGRIVEVIPSVGSVVLTGDGELLVTEVQLDDNPPICSADLLNKLSYTLGR